MNRYSVVALGTLIVVCILGVSLGIYFGLKSSDNVKSFDIFHASFSASLDVDTIERDELGTEKTYLKIEWNSATRKMNFQQTEVFSSNYDFDYELFFIMADDKATAGISHINSSLAFCIEDISKSQWVSVFQHTATVDNWQSGTQSDECRGDIWYTKYTGDSIEICIYDNQLQYVTHQKSTATVTSWTATDQQNIHISSDVLNGPCHDVSQITCSNLHNPPKVKKNSGVSPTTCLFVHGAGENPPGNDVLANLPHYWGDIRSYTLNCSSHKFLHYNSKNNGWDDDQVHQHFCDVAATNGIIRDTVIFAHSLGNLVIAAALYKNTCTFNQTTSRWFSVQGPWTGSVAANTLTRICRNPTILERLVRRLLRGEGYCKPTENMEFGVYTTLTTDYISPTGIRYDHLRDVGRRYVSGVMCGISSWGLEKNYKESSALLLMQWYSELGNPNDGMVAFDSCKLNDELFEERTSKPYYKDKFNHAEGTCRYGGCPCEWYEYMH